ncbi:sigma-70 family RNA polymerase sigma factor [Paraflavitalea speifideaquila]|uniref:RNA polymerase sigma factor n=1 Tax=Paraflavitalea speifideaquila TaxID=3076558 RepID=UPI0028E510B7|nr:sigma-70 family RNA polymerase sigma factor [Paraflavitalea speifideiaquila]
MTTASDSSLIPAFHKNEPQAIKTIFREYYTSMVHYAYQLINDQQEAAEMVVNTFLKLIAMRRNFQTMDDVKTFLLVTIRNGCYDYLRCLDLERPAQKELLSLTDLVPADNTALLSTEQLLALYEGINKLTDPCAEVFKLYFYNKMTTEDVATQLGIPVKTVRAHKTKAIRILRTTLSKSLTITPSLN